MPLACCEQGEVRIDGALRDVPFASVYFRPWSGSGAWKAGLSVFTTISGVKQSQNGVHAPNLREL